MSLLTVSQLRTEITRAQAAQTLIDLLDQLGFSATSWQSGSIQLTFLHLFAYVWAWLSTLVTTLVTFGFNDLAEDDALTYFSDSHYDNQRITAVAAQHQCTLTCASGSGPYAIAVSDLVVSDGTYTFRNLTAGTLADGGTLNLTFQAEIAGANGNVAINTITTMVTTLAGVTVNNPDLGLGNGSILLNGTNAESDATLRSRNRTKWAILSYETPADGYVYIAQSAVTNCRVDVDDSNPRGPGTIDIYVAAENGLAVSGEETLVQNALLARVMGANHLTYAAAADTLTWAFTVYYDSNYTAAAVKVAVDAALTAYINSAPIGGFDYSPGPSNVILRNEIIQTIEGVAGVKTVSLTTPASDFSVTAHHVALVGSLPAVGSYTPV